MGDVVSLDDYRSRLDQLLVDMLRKSQDGTLRAVSVATLECADPKGGFEVFASNVGTLNRVQARRMLDNIDVLRQELVDFVGTDPEAA